MPLSDTSADTVDLVRRVLGVARRRLGMDLSWVGEFRDGFQNIDIMEGDADLFGLKVGDGFDLASSYCIRVIRGDIPGLIQNTERNPITSSLEVTKSLDIGAYAGVPLLDDSGEPFGMLCCINRQERSYLSDEHAQILDMTADLIVELLSGESPSVSKERSIRDRIRRVIEEEAFHPVFHPIVSLESGKVQGVEALTRFSEEPARPDLWFTEAATVGMGVELELAAIRAALEHMDVLPEGTFMSVNASPETITDYRLARTLLQFDPQRIVVELTEHVAISDYADLVASLQELRRLGVRTAVDDVGAGFASFSHVLELSPNLLKVDMSITRGIDSDPARQAIATGVVDLARSLGAQVVAEGVEAETELAAVAELGVAAVQGFLLARPAELPLKRTTHHLSLAAPTPGRRAIAHGDHRLDLAMRYSPIGFCLVAKDGTFTHVNPALAAMLGYSPQELMRLTFQELTHPSDLEADEALLAECLDGIRSTYRMDKRYVRSDGSILWGDLTVTLVRTNDGAPDHFISQILDVTEKRTREELLRSRASEDDLTSLANRARAEHHMADLEGCKVPFGIVVCKLTDLGDLRASEGVEVADQVLKAAASRLRQVVRDKDLVARWGEDEFILVVSDSRPGELIDVAERISAAAVDPITLADERRVPHPLVSVGLAHWAPNRPAGVSQVIQEATADREANRGRLTPLRTGSAEATQSADSAHPVTTTGQGAFRTT